MAPTCSNCGGTEFVWADELKTGGTLARGPLSIRVGGELPLGTRICRSCGHADLFLRNVQILQSPHHWRPGEFTPISGGGKSPHRAHDGTATPMQRNVAPSSPTTNAVPSTSTPHVTPLVEPTPPSPPAVPVDVDPPLAPAPVPIASEGSTDPAAPMEPGPAEPAPPPQAAPVDSEQSPKKATARRRASRPKRESSDP